MAQNTMLTNVDTSAFTATTHMAMVHPKPAPSTARSELSREVRIALDGLATRGVTSPRRTMRNSHASGMAPFICG
jgi:hypothetical protein